MKFHHNFCWRVWGLGVSVHLWSGVYLVLGPYEVFWLKGRDEEEERPLPLSTYEEAKKKLDGIAAVLQKNELRMSGHGDRPPEPIPPQNEFSREDDPGRG